MHVYLSSRTVVSLDMISYIKADGGANDVGLANQACISDCAARLTGSTDHYVTDIKMVMLDGL